MSIAEEYAGFERKPTADSLAAQPSVSEPPKLTPVTEFDGTSGYIQTSWMPAEQPLEHREILEKFGYDPDRVQIIGEPLIKRWEFGYTTEELVDNGAGKLVKVRTGSETKWLASYRFKIGPIEAALVGDLEAVITRARGWPPAPTTGPSWMVFQAGDIQLGKRSRDGGTEQIIQRYLQSVEAAASELKQLRRHGVEGLQLSFPGDCIEGKVSQGGRNQGYLTDTVVTEQLLIFKRLLVHTIETLAPLANQVFVDVVNGNHDEAQRDLNTWPGNGWATTAAALVDDELKANPIAYRHVTVRVPDKWSGFMTVPVGDTVVTVVHGHQWRQRHKALDWLAKQAVHNQAPAGAQLVQFGHYHTVSLEMHQTKTLISGPTFDCGSDHYREKHGAGSRRGGLVYLLKAGEVSRMSVL